MTYTFPALVQAYLDCRQSKRNTASALAFEQYLECNLCALHAELTAGTYQPGRSICFVITRPKPREVWAADFRDRIVHHLLYNRISPRFYASFIADSCACIPGRGTLYAAQRLESKVRSVTQLEQAAIRAALQVTLPVMRQASNYAVERAAQAAWVAFQRDGGVKVDIGG